MSDNDQTTTETKLSPEDIHLPPNSYWPIILAFGFTLILGGLAISLSFALVGLLITFISAIGWVIEPVHDEEH